MLVLLVLVSLAIILSRAKLLFTGGILGLLGAACAAALGPVHLYVTNARLPRAWGPACITAALIAGATLAFVNARVPLEERSSYAGEILYATGDQNSQRVVFTSNNTGLEVFVDRRSHFSTLDQARYFEGLTRGMDHTKQTALVLSAGGAGCAKQLLKFASLKQLTLVAPSLAFTHLSARLPRLRQSFGPALADPRVNLIEAEAFPWLTETTAQYDLIVADVPAPIDQRAAKYYTNHFLTVLSERLTDRGVAVLSAFSPSRTPAAHRAVLALANADLHALHVHGIPSLGDWAFLELSKRRDHSASDVSTLHTPRVAQLFQAEYGAFAYGEL
jgi:spermidine synthase